MDRRFVLIGLQVLLFTVFVYTNDIDLNQLKSQLPAGITIPQELSNFTLDDFKTIVKDKCSKAAGAESESYNDLEKEVPNLMNCVTEIVNTTAIQIEIDEARPKGELDAVFNKYCRKRPELLTCIDNLKKKIEPCLDTEELTYANITMRIFTSLLNFVCHKDGDQIALFIAEKGPECIESSREEISDCANGTFSKYVPKEGYSDIKELPRFVMGPEQCRDMNDFQACVVRTLEKCEEITPANIVESMFRFVRNETTCVDPKTSSLKANSASSTSIFGVFAITMIALYTSSRFY